MNGYEYAVREYQQWQRGEISRMAWQVELLLNAIGRTPEERAERRLRADIQDAHNQLRRERNVRRAEWGNARRLHVINLYAAIEAVYAQS